MQVFDSRELCSHVSGPQVLPHSEIIRLHSEEGYTVDVAQGMSYDEPNCETYSGRIDTFHSDWFDVAEVSQSARMSAPSTSASASVEEPINDKKVEDIPNPVKDDE